MAESNFCRQPDVAPANAICLGRLAVRGYRAKLEPHEAKLVSLNSDATLWCCEAKD